MHTRRAVWGRAVLQRIGSTAVNFVHILCVFAMLKLLLPLAVLGCVAVSRFPVYLSRLTYSYEVLNTFGEPVSQGLWTGALLHRCSGSTGRCGCHAMPVLPILSMLQCCGLAVVLLWPC